jgi:hypothetical protein
MNKIMTDVSFGDSIIKFSSWMLKMKVTINLLPRRKLYALDVYTGVEVHELEWQAPVRKDPTVLILCPHIRQTYGGKFKEKMLVLLVIELRFSSLMACYVSDRAIPAYQSWRC